MFIVQTFPGRPARVVPLWRKSDFDGDKLLVECDTILSNRLTLSTEKSFHRIAPRSFLSQNPKGNCVELCPDPGGCQKRHPPGFKPHFLSVPSSPPKSSLPKSMPNQPRMKSMISCAALHAQQQPRSGQDDTQKTKCRTLVHRIPSLFRIIACRYFRSESLTYQDYDRPVKEKIPDKRSRHIFSLHFFA